MHGLFESACGRRVVKCGVAGCVIYLGVWVGVVRGQTESAVDFNRDIRPLLSDRCFACHGPDASERKADLRLDVETDAKEYAIVPGDPDASELWRRINSDDPEQQMPPPDSGKRLTADEIALLHRWLEQGAVWQGHWAFEPIRRPSVPSARAKVGLRIRLIVLYSSDSNRPGWRRHRTPRETLIRRVSFDLIGLPPTLDDAEAFVSDSSENAWEASVDRLLESPHYGERMA